MAKEFSAKMRLTREEGEFNSSFFFIDDCSQLFAVDLEKHLHHYEKERYITFKSDVRKVSFMLGRYCAKKAIQCFHDPQMSLSSINIESGIFSQPIIRTPNLPNIRVSISHDDLAAVAIAYPEEHPMAIDIESIDKEKSIAIKEQLTDTELKLIDDFKDIQQDTLFTVFWTAKESLSKVLKTGLTTQLSIFELASLTNQDSFIKGTFTNFFQYQFIAKIFNGKVISILLPRKTRVSFENLPSKPFIF